MKYRGVVALLAIVLGFVGCQSDADETIPDELVGVWKTSAPGYEDNYLELRKDEIVFGQGKARFSLNRVYKVEKTSAVLGEDAILKIYYTDQEGHDFDTSLFYNLKGVATIRLKNHRQMEWKLAERRAAEVDYDAPHQPARFWRDVITWNNGILFLGLAMISGAALWRARQPREAQGLPEKVNWDFFWRERARREAGTASVPKIIEEQRRRSERIMLMVPVQVSGTDANGNAFSERTVTLSINRNGAFIRLKNLPKQGDQVSVTNVATRQTCRFRVCESGTDSSGDVTAWGVECLDPESNFWQIRFPETTPEPTLERIVTALVVCANCFTREVADLTVSQYHDMLETGSLKRHCADCGTTTEWSFILVEAAGKAEIPGEAPPVYVPQDSELREKRIIARLPIRLRLSERGPEEQTSTENISRSGLCFSAKIDLKVNDIILVSFESAGGALGREGRARVMWSRSMGEHRKTLYGIKLDRKAT